MELIFLGTGAGVPSPERNVSGIALSLAEERGSFWLFDCGEGTQHQIMRSPLKLSRLEKVFITHLHGDHLYGLPGLLASRAYQGGLEPLNIFGPPGIAEFIQTALRISGSHVEYAYNIIEVKAGVIFQDHQFTVICARLDHRIESYGYRIVEHDRAGELLSAKLLSEGVQPGPIYKQIKSGVSPVIYDGRLLDPKNYVGAAISGRKVAILGDTRLSKHSVELAREVDVLVHEATFAADLQQLADKYHHATSVHAATVAYEADAKALIMTHFSSRYQGDDILKLVAEARQIFGNSHAAYDLMRFPLKVTQN